MTLHLHIEIVNASLDDFWPSVFVMGLCGDIRPPKGSPGLVDWRTGGMLSELIRNGFITASVAEQSLLWSQRRKSKIYVFGMGKRIPPTPDTTRRVAYQIINSLCKAKEQNAILVADPLLGISAEKGAESSFMEGAVDAFNEGAAKEPIRFIVPCGVKKAEEIHENFRRGILKLGEKAECIGLTIVTSYEV